MSGNEPDLGDLSADGIRALLADARNDEPVPDDVAAALDATLADLVAGRATAGDAETEPDAQVVPLAGRRRSRLSTRLLVAAAAVVIAGAGTTGIVHALRSADNSGPASNADAGRSVPAPVAGPAILAPTPAHAPDALGAVPTRAALQSLTSAHFSRQVRQYVQEQKDIWAPADLPRSPFNGSLDSMDAGGSSAASGKAPAPAGGTAELGGTPAVRDRSTQRCDGPVHVRATLTPIRLDGDPAVLAIFGLHQGDRLVEAFSCDGQTVLASAILHH